MTKETMLKKVAEWLEVRKYGVEYGDVTAVWTANLHLATLARKLKIDYYTL